MQVGNNLLEQGHLQPVGLRSRNSIKNRGGGRVGTGEKNVFCDASNALYRFVSIVMHDFLLLQGMASVGSHTSKNVLKGLLLHVERISYRIFILQLNLFLIKILIKTAVFKNFNIPRLPSDVIMHKIYIT